MLSVSIADATLASPQLINSYGTVIFEDCFNRRRDACFPATKLCARQKSSGESVSIADATLASPQPALHLHAPLANGRVSIADATLASPQRQVGRGNRREDSCFNRRRDACFPATAMTWPPSVPMTSFNRRRDACFPATSQISGHGKREENVSIADATLASPQRTAWATAEQRRDTGFQSQTRRLLPRNMLTKSCAISSCAFQSQTRRLLPRNIIILPFWPLLHEFQSQTRRLLPRNAGPIKLA